MEQLIKVLKMIADKYMENINVTLDRKSCILEYYIQKNDERYLYKTLQIIQYEKNLKVTFLPEEITKITTLKGLEDIILTLEKQANVKQYTQEEVQQIKDKYTRGTKVELIKMYDYISEVPTGTKGVINFVDDIGTIHVVWENERSLGLVVGIDEFRILEENE